MQKVEDCLGGQLLLLGLLPLRVDLDQAFARQFLARLGAVLLPLGFSLLGLGIQLGEALSVGAVRLGLTRLLGAFLARDWP